MIDVAALKPGDLVWWRGYPDAGIRGSGAYVDTVVMLDDGLFAVRLRGVHQEGDSGFLYSRDGTSVPLPEELYVLNPQCDSTALNIVMVEPAYGA